MRYSVNTLEAPMSAMLKVLAAPALAVLLGLVMQASATAVETTAVGSFPKRGLSIGLERPPNTFYIKERITLALAERVLRINVSEYDTIELNSNGGSLLAARKIAKFIRNNELATHISYRGYYASACVLIFQSGIQRTAGPKSLLLLHSAKEMQDGTRSKKWTRRYIEWMIEFGASRRLAEQFPEIGDWILTAAEAREFCIVQTVTSDSNRGRTARGLNGEAAAPVSGVDSTTARLSAPGHESRR